MDLFIILLVVSSQLQPKLTKVNLNFQYFFLLLIHLNKIKNHTCMQVHTTLGVSMFDREVLVHSFLYCLFSFSLVVPRISLNAAFVFDLLLDLPAIIYVTHKW